MNDCTIDLLLYIHDNDEFCELCEIVNHFDRFSLCVSYFALSGGYLDVLGSDPC